MRLKNDSAEAIIDPACGGRLASLRIGGHEVLVTEGSSDTEWGCYPMAPWAGRVREGRFEWENQTQRLPINWPPHAIHGTVFGAAWTQDGLNSIRCPLGPGWPWSGHVRSVFSLGDDSFEWRMEVHADAEPFPVVLGWHPWFRREVAGCGPVRFEFEPATMYVRDPSGLPTGSTVEPAAGPWDDCFTGVRSNPRLLWPNGLTLDVASSCDHWVIYDEPAHALCIEPQSGPPDAFNLGGFEVAAPGKPVMHTLKFRWRHSGSTR